jgi:TRAP-type mannitol/chloroaromatic compound transport system permease large subunit
MLLFTMKSVAPRSITMSQIFGAVTPYVILGVMMLVLVLVFPALATWLPAVLIGK